MPQPLDDGTARHLKRGAKAPQGTTHGLIHTSAIQKHPLAVLLVPILTAWGLLVAWHFPWSTDDPVRREDEIAAFYKLHYSATVVQDTALAKAAENAKVTYNIDGQVRAFVTQYGLERKHILDVGSGSGYLQDVVEHYTGLDISTGVAPLYHKRFVAGTATAMPFHDGEFDAAWSIWVLEHIPNPEAALSEIRRVVKPGGYLFLMPAWDCKPWAAEGYEARPYRDFGIGGKVIKASIPIRTHPWFWSLTNAPARAIRKPAQFFGPTQLHYRRLEPNYQAYWQADSDAVNDLDSEELAMWFESRGDHCLNCGGSRLIAADRPIIIRRR